MNTNKEKNFISAVVYVFNSGSCIFDFLSQLEGELGKTFEKAELICVNDASQDESVQEIKRFAAQSKSVVTVLNMSFHQGMELSMNAGVDLAIGDFVYEFEAPVFTYPQELLRAAYEKALQGYDIVSVSPKASRNFLSKLFYRVYNNSSNAQYPLQTEALNLLSRRAINRVCAMSKSIAYRKAVYANCGLKKAVISYEPTKALPSIDGSQKKDYRNTAVDALILYTNLAFRCTMTFSFIMMLAMFAMVVYTLIIYFQGIPIAGWSSTILFLSFAFFGLFAVLTAIIKYLSLLLRLNSNRLSYVIESIDKLR